jgi:hypothetical protein
MVDRIIGTSVAIILFISLLLVTIIGLRIIESTDNKPVLDDTPYFFENVKVVEMTQLYEYLSKQKSDFDVTYNYIVESDSIQVIFNDIESADLKNIFIILDSANSQIHITDVNYDLSMEYDSYGIINLTVQNTNLIELGSDILKIVNQYYNEIPEDAGDAKHYGEDANIITNPNGSLEVEKD